MTLKPAIANQEFEFDAREILGVPTTDWDEVVTWPDTSGQANNGTGAGTSRRYEKEGFAGTLPDVRCEDSSQDGWTFSGTALATTRHTVFIVIQAIDISNHLGIWGSDAGASPGNRYIHLFAKSDGSLIYNRKDDAYDIESAAGTIVNGGKYVITARVDATAGMTLRVNGVQVGVSAGDTGANLAFSGPTRIGRITDLITGGIGQVFGDKRYEWVSFHSDAVSDADVLLMEAYLGTRFGIAGVGTNPTKPTIANQEGEYDIASYSSQTEGDQVGTWTDTSGNANNATITGTPEYEAGAWSPGENDVRFTSGGQITFDGTGLAAQNDIILFLVFNTFDLSSNEPLTGGSSFTDRRMLETFIRSTGSVVFSFGTNEGALAVESSAGEIVADGTCYVLTLQFTSTGGKLIRKAVPDVGGTTGSQIAINASSTATLLAWDSARIADIAGVVPSNNMKLAWFSANLTNPSIDEIEQMETWLLETFCGQDLPTPGLPRVTTPIDIGHIQSPGSLRNFSHSGLIQIRSITALGWSWEETFGLLNVKNSDDMDVMAFIKKAWHNGTIFDVQHLLLPGSGITPNGLGTSGIMVKGVNQRGDSVITDGWPTSTANCVRAGDVISIAGDQAVYLVTEDSSSDGAGEAVISINPNLRSSPADNASVKTTGVTFKVAITNRSRFDGSQSPGYYAGMSVVFSEAIL